MGGMRASIYNSMPVDGVQQLVNFMQVSCNAEQPLPAISNILQVFICTALQKACVRLGWLALYSIACLHDEVYNCSAPQWWIMRCFGSWTRYICCRNLPQQMPKSGKQIDFVQIPSELLYIHHLASQQIVHAQVYKARLSRIRFTQNQA